MQHPLEFEIRDRLSAYLAGEISLHDFEDWFFAKTWSIDALDEPALLDLVYQIKLDWAEFTEGVSSLEEFRSMLRSIVEQYTITFSPDTPKLVTGTSSKNMQLPLAIMRSGLSVDIKSSVVYA
jgi:hypothetical protein